MMTQPTDVLLKARPKAAKALYVGRYADVLRGWEAQAARFRRYLAEECAAARLPSAEGLALLELAGSEFWASIVPDAQTAVGEAFLFRTIGGFPAGSIKKGHRFARTANTNARPPIAAAQFVASAPVYVAAGQQSVTVPLEAVTPGTDPNALQFVGSSPPAGTAVDALFDAAFATAGVLSAGGSAGMNDPWARLIAAASYCGQFGPANTALIAGAFQVPRVRHTALTLDSDRGVSRLFVADISWGSSGRLATIVAQNLRDRWLGFGARAEVLPIKNELINVTASVTLKGPQFLDDISDINDSIRLAIKSYFDDRPDFWTFRNRALRGLVSQCDKRILTCSAVAVLDSVGVTVAEPASTLSGSATYATHFFLTDDAISTTFVVPS